eukprot:1154390_1
MLYPLAYIRSIFLEVIHFVLLTPFIIPLLTPFSMFVKSRNSTRHGTKSGLQESNHNNCQKLTALRIHNQNYDTADKFKLNNATDVQTTAAKCDHDPCDDGDDPFSILQESEHHIHKMFLILLGSTCMTFGVSGFGIPVYLYEEFKASSSVIGIASALELVVSCIRCVAVPYLATNYPRYFSYDITATARLFLSTMFTLVFCLTNDMNVVIICGILNNLMSVQSPTIQYCISLLLPATRAGEYMTMHFIVGTIAVILSTLTIPLPFDVLCYLSFGIHALLFLFALAFVWKKEGAVLAKQMKYYDESFYTELKRREVHNPQNKYRRRSSLAQSIIQYLDSSEVQSPSSFKHDQMVEFPVYQIAARKALEKDVPSREHQLMKLS